MAGGDRPVDVAQRVARLVGASGESVLGFSLQRLVQRALFPPHLAVGQQAGGQGSQRGVDQDLVLLQPGLAHQKQPEWVAAAHLPGTQGKNAAPGADGVGAPLGG